MTIGFTNVLPIEPTNLGSDSQLSYQTVNSPECSTQMERFGTKNRSSHGIPQKENYKAHSHQDQECVEARRESGPNRQENSLLENAKKVPPKKVIKGELRRGHGFLQLTRKQLLRKLLPRQLLPCQPRTETLVENLILISYFIPNFFSLQLPNKSKYFLFLQIQVSPLVDKDSFISTHVVPTPTKVAKIRAEYSPLPVVFPENVKEEHNTGKQKPGTPEVNIICT